VTGNGLVYSSYLGGKTSQAGAGIAVNTAVDGTNTGDQAVIAGWTTSSKFPVTTGSKQGTFGGVEDAFISQFPDVANCTTTHTLSGFTVNATVTAPAISFLAIRISLSGSSGETAQRTVFRGVHPLARSRQVLLHSRFRIPIRLEATLLRPR